LKRLTKPLFNRTTKKSVLGNTQNAFFTHKKIEAKFLPNKTSHFLLFFIRNNKSYRYAKSALTTKKNDQAQAKHIKKICKNTMKILQKISNILICIKKQEGKLSKKKEPQLFWRTIRLYFCQN